jgi:hypothetical protein
MAPEPEAEEAALAALFRGLAPRRSRPQGMLWDARLVRDHGAVRVAVVLRWGGRARRARVVVQHIVGSGHVRQLVLYERRGPVVTLASLRTPETAQGAPAALRRWLRVTQRAMRHSPPKRRSRRKPEAPGQRGA